MVKHGTQVARATSHIENGRSGVEERKQVFQGMSVLCAMRLEEREERSSGTMWGAVMVAPYPIDLNSPLPRGVALQGLLGREESWTH